jgi:uncharacterized protein (DUF1330 family)
MSAYVVMIRHQTKSLDELQTYASLAKEARAGHSMTRLASYGELTLLEGSPMEGAVILAFPDRAAAQAWYDSPAYQKAKTHRNLGADYTVFIVDGVAG